MVVIKATGMVSTPLCITALYNGTLVKSTLTGIGNDFIALKNRKAFYYWYLYEGESIQLSTYDSYRLL